MASLPNHDSPHNQQTALIYARVSTQEQGKGFSIETQLEAERRYCGDRGYTVIREFTDTHSGTEFDRPGINELIDALSTIDRKLWCYTTSIVWDVNWSFRPSSNAT